MRSSPCPAARTAAAWWCGSPTDRGPARSGTAAGPTEQHTFKIRPLLRDQFWYRHAGGILPTSHPHYTLAHHFRPVLCSYKNCAYLLDLLAPFPRALLILDAHVGHVAVVERVLVHRPGEHISSHSHLS